MLAASPSVRAIQFGTTLVCSHIAHGVRPVGDVSLLVDGDSHFVRLCDPCARLSKIPGGLHIDLPRRRLPTPPRPATSLSAYLEGLPEPSYDPGSPTDDFKLGQA